MNELTAKFAPYVRMRFEIFTRLAIKVNMLFGVNTKPCVFDDPTA
jgi:hypothetical protein